MKKLQKVSVIRPATFMAGYRAPYSPLGKLLGPTHSGNEVARPGDGIPIVFLFLDMKTNQYQYNISL